MKRLLIVILLGCVCLLFVYRADNLLPESSGPPPGPDTPTRTWTDMLDRQVTLKQDVRRIVLLRTMDIHLLVALLGRDLDKRLVAVGNDFASNDIDGYRKFSEVFQLGHLVSLGNLYADDGINPETVMGLRPDMILVDTQFKERGSVKKMIRLGLPVVFIDLNTDPFFGAPRAMRMLGRMLGVQPKADEMAAFTTMRTQAVLDRIDALRRENRPRPVLYFEQGNTVPAKIGITDGDISYSWGKVWYRLGADNIGVGANFQSLNPELILTRNPEVIVIGGSNWDPTSNIMRLGFQVNARQAIAHLSEYTLRTGWSGLSAIRNHRLYALHYNYYGRPYDFTCFEAMAKMLYPNDFQDLDPEADLELFFRKYLPFPYSGLHSVQWAPSP